MTASATEVRAGPGTVIPLGDLALGVAVVGFVSAWCWAAGGTLPPAVPVAIAAAVSAYYAVGTLATSWRKAWDGLEVSFPLRFLAGYAIVNSVLFAVVWTSATAFRPAFLVLLAAAAGGLVWARPSVERSWRPRLAPAALVTVLSLVAATLWARDCLPPTELHGAVTVFRPWVDSFFHAAQIASVAGTQGAERLEDVQYAFVPARFYHYAPYVTPALVKAFSPTTAYAAYAGVFVPMGVLVTGLAAYVLVASWWGAWPGFAAAAALLLLPDAASHGTHSSLMAYHWMQLVGAAGMYGVAILALAWAVLLRGCATGNRVQVAVGWGLGALTLAFKAQFFVASALLLWMYPPLTFRGVAPARRAAWVAGGLAAYAAGVWVASRSSSFPTMRLDGSSLEPFLGLLMGNTGAGAFRDLFAPHLGRGASQVEVVAWGVAYLLACTAGLFAVGYAVLAVVLRRRSDPRVLAFPALVLVNFLVMAAGLAYDERGIGSREELLHRPFVWAYFVTAAWVGGAAAFALLGSAGAASRRRLGIAAATVPLLAYPALRGSAGGQVKQVGFSLANVSVPSAVTEVASFLREHAQPGDVVQDLHGDAYMALTGLSERRPFMVRYWLSTAYGKEHVATRAAVVEALARTRDAAALAEAAREVRLRWMVLHPGDAVAWPPEVLDRPAFQAGGYRVYALQ